MTSIRNPNHPKPGSRITVEPIRRVEDITSIKRLLVDRPRDLLLFTLGINNGIRTGDLLRLKVEDVSRVKVGESLSIKESKTGKVNVIVINRTVFKVLWTYLDSMEHQPGDYLFRSSRGTNRSLTIQQVNRMVKRWCRSINLTGNYGSHTLRKTFGYIQRTKYGIGFEVLCKRFNHSTPSVTMRYLGVSDEEVMDILQNDI